MSISAEQRSKFAAFHWQWRRLQMSEKFSSLTKNYKQTNKNYALFSLNHTQGIEEDLKGNNAFSLWYVLHGHVIAQGPLPGGHEI